MISTSSAWVNIPTVILARNRVSGGGTRLTGIAATRWQSASISGERVAMYSEKERIAARRRLRNGERAGVDLAALMRAAVAFYCSSRSECPECLERRSAWYQSQPSSHERSHKRDARHLC